jgi:hypothetical protein
MPDSPCYSPVIQKKGIFAVLVIFVFRFVKEQKSRSSATNHAYVEGHGNYRYYIMTGKFHDNNVAK